MKVAIPTNDGETVANHFGRTQYFWVADVEKGDVINTEVRENRDRHHGHGDHGGLIQLLRDVDVIVCVNLGMQIYNDLIASGKKICLARNVSVTQSIQDILKDNLNEIQSNVLCRGHEFSSEE